MIEVRYCIDTKMKPQSTSSWRPLC